MLANHSVIKEAYRATLADWDTKAIGSHGNARMLIGQTASLASIWTNHEISEKNVIKILRTLA